MTFDLPFAAYEPHGSAWGVSGSSAAATPQRAPEAFPDSLGAISATLLLVNARSRVEIATSIERLINLLDEIEGDPDLEDGADSESSLGGWVDGRLVTASGRVEHDLEADNADDEPYLGASETHPCSRLHLAGSQEGWAAGVRDDRECDDAEHGIADVGGMGEQFAGCLRVPFRVVE